MPWAGDQGDWQSCVQVDSPICALAKPVSVDEGFLGSKLELALALMQQGWTFDDGAALTYLHRAPLQVPRSVILGPAIAMKCLVLKAAIFSKGSSQIRLDKPEGYVKRLLDLNDLSKFHDAEGFDDLTNADFEKLAKGIPLDRMNNAIVEAALMDGDDGMCDEVLGGDMIGAPDDILASAFGGAQEVELRRPPIRSRRFYVARLNPPGNLQFCC